MDALKPCPFCGQPVYLEKKPLWQGSHGYPGCFEYVIECNNKECGCRINLLQNDTVYNTDEEARKNVIKAWNTRKWFGKEQ